LRIAVRRWHTVEVALEFRGFVGPNGRLNAISQYYHDCYFAEYGSDPAAVRLLELSMLACWEEVHPALGELYPAGYVIDFAVNVPLSSLREHVDQFLQRSDEHRTIDSHTGNATENVNATENTDHSDDHHHHRRCHSDYRLPVLVIELNPFDEYTDDALFNWRLNRKTLRCGPLRTRVVTEEQGVRRRSTWWTSMLSAHLRSRRKGKHTQ
jgi:hypothetical protein